MLEKRQDDEYYDGDDNGDEGDYDTPTATENTDATVTDEDTPTETPTSDDYNGKSTYHDRALQKKK